MQSSRTVKSVVSIYSFELRSVHVLERIRIIDDEHTEERVGCVGPETADELRGSSSLHSQECGGSFNKLSSRIIGVARYGRLEVSLTCCLSGSQTRIATNSNPSGLGVQDRVGVICHGWLEMLALHWDWEPYRCRSSWVAGNVSISKTKRPGSRNARPYEGTEISLVLVCQRPQVCQGRIGVTRNRWLEMPGRLAEVRLGILGVLSVVVRTPHQRPNLCLRMQIKTNTGQTKKEERRAAAELFWGVEGKC